MGRCLALASVSLIAAGVLLAYAAAAHAAPNLPSVPAGGYAPGTGIYLAWPRKGLRTLSPAATAFRDWLIEEARGTPTVERKVPRVRRRAS